MARKRNAVTRNLRSRAKRRQATWKSLSQPTGHKKEPLHGMLGEKAAGKSDAETLAITIPCRIDKPDRVAPLYLVEQNEFGGPESGVWQCQDCTAIFRTRRAWEKHKGIKWIVQSGEPVCVSS